MPPNTLDADPADSRASRLRAALGTKVILPGDSSYDDARLAWNRAVDQRPFAIVRPHTVPEVVEAVRAAAATGLRVAAQSTGHAAATLSGAGLSETMLLSLSGLHGVTIDPASCTATIAGGTVWNEVLEAAAPYGLTALHGSAGDISVAGYALSGGLSFYGRRHGLSINGVRAARVVTASGDLVTADGSENPDLFWALRGGSGSLGVVVELEIDLLPYADVFAGMLLWDAGRANDVAHAWADWTTRAPESVTTSLRIMHFPPIPDLPPFLRGRSVVVVDGAILEEDDDAASLLEPLRALSPEQDTFDRIPTPELVHMHMDPPEPTPASMAHAMLHSLPAAAIDAFVHAAMEAQPMISEIRHAGAAIAREADDGGALSHLEGDYVLSAIAVVPEPGLAPSASRSTHAVVDALAGWHLPTLTPTFVDEPGARPEDLFGTALPRLVEAKHRHDPQNMFAAAHPIL